MLIHNLGKSPVEHHESYQSSELDRYDIERLEELGVEEVWYWYEQGSWEGDGQMLMRRGTDYSLHSMSHCSCYGPMENVKFTPEPFDKLFASCSDGLMKQCLPLFAEAEWARFP